MPTSEQLRVFLISAASVFALLASSCTRDEPQDAASTPKDEPAPTTSSLAEQPAPAREQALEPAAAQGPANVAAPATPNVAPAPPAKAGAALQARPDTCKPLCERTVSLGCGPRDECLTACAQVNDGSICGSEMSAFMNCALTHPAERWECTENGVAAIRDGYCDAQQQAFIRCFETAAN